jgi:hypothetical protein
MSRIMYLEDMIVNVTRSSIVVSDGWACLWGGVERGRAGVGIQ